MNKFLCAILLALPAVALAGPGTPAPIADNKLVEVDTQIVAHQHAVNQEEIAMGKLAQANSTSPAVKTYGATLVKDHTAGDKDLTTFAKAKGIPAIPADTSEPDAAKKEKADMVAQLRALKGAAFDRMFADMMAKGHDKEVTRIATDITQATNKALVMMLTKTKPVLERHAATAHALVTSTAASGSGTASGSK
jgi:putative membrane protein